MDTARQSVLLVDDEPQVLVALEDLLSDEFTVLKTVSPETALELAEREPRIAAVVSDQRMPGMNGDELLSRLHRSSDASRIHLPLADEPSEEMAQRRVPTRPPAGAGTVLVVEDDDEVRQVTVRILRDHGYTVLETGRAKEAAALAAAQPQGVDLLLVDVVMPGMSGPKLAAELSALIPRLRVLLMSGYAGSHSEGDLTLASGMGYIEKPFSPAGLAKVVAELVGDS